MIRTLPTVVKLRIPERELVAGVDNRIMCSLVLDRTKNFAGPMQIHLFDPIPGISAEAVTIGAGATSADVKIQIDRSMARDSSVPLRFRAVGMMDDDVQVVSEATVKLVLRDGVFPAEDR